MASPQAETSAAQDAPQPPSPEAETAQPGTEHPHNFTVQKDLHQQIRNDPDYDDWEYGTEPLPQEAWPASAPQDKAG
ncbi:MAG: hypothetical protein ACKOZT_13160 [Cyanobium sp.]